MSPDSFFTAIANAVAGTTVPEWIAIVTALIYVVLAAKENSWCWIFGIVSAGIYTWFNFSLGLPMDAWLSVYYCIVGIYGWYAWVAKKNNTNNASVLLHRMDLKNFLFALAAGTAGTFALAQVSIHFTKSPVPYFDAALTSFSLVATWMTARKILENWLFWIVIDAAYIVLYAIRHAPSTATLFFIYTIIAIFGFLKWRKKLVTSNV
jgi:nicotinamide mononucleotide transporter